MVLVELILIKLTLLQVMLMVVSMVVALAKFNLLALLTLVSKAEQSGSYILALTDNSHQHAQQTSNYEYLQI